MEACTMNMHKQVMTIILLGALLLAGCEGNNNTPGPGGNPYIGGTLGITANFESFGIVESGVPSIFEGESFPVEITLKNKGEENVDAGEATIRLRGISENDFTGISFEDENSGSIEKVSEINLDGGEETIDLGDAEYKHDIKTSFYDVIVFAEYEYPYATHVAVPQVCFKEDLVDTSICSIEGIKDSASSAAPIVVSSVTQKRAGAGIIALEFIVENRGGGEVTIPEGEFDSRYGQIHFGLDDSSDPSSWECKLGGSENEGRLTDGKATIRCKLNTPLPEDTLYTKQIDMTISYRYRDLIQQNIRINNKEE